MEPVELKHLVGLARAVNEGIATADGAKPGPLTELYSESSALLSYSFVYASVWLVSSGTVLIHEKEKIHSMQIVKAAQHFWVAVLVGADKKEFAIDMSALQYPDVSICCGLGFTFFGPRPAPISLHRARSRACARVWAAGDLAWRRGRR